MKKLSTILMLVLPLLVSFNVFSIPVLSSLPAALPTIYLDFGGHDVNCAYWNNGNPFTCAPSGLTDTQITEVFNRVAEDYRPFNINITTDESKFLAAPLSSRIRIIVTPTSGWCQGVGGISFIGSFSWGDDTPAFVFTDRLGPNSPKMVAECCSHESGHTVGLSHQSTYDSTCNLTATYNDGAGTGEASWAPIMGNSYYRNMSGWNNGPTPYGCADTQDNLSIITTQNGFTYRSDDYSDDINNNPFPIVLGGNNIEGIISTNTDKDAFTFSLSRKSAIHINIRPFSVDSNYEGANLDVKMLLYNSSKELIRTYDPAATMNVEADTILTKGCYFMVIDGTGNSNVDDYGSLGSYSINSTAYGILPVLNATLSGMADKSRHHLNWNIISDEPVHAVMVELAEDNIHFKPISLAGSLSNAFTYSPIQKSDLYYRIKVTGVSNQSAYSNTVMLKGVSIPGKPFRVSTLIKNEITVDAAESYHYLVTDINGNLIVRGSGQQGFNKLDMSLQPGGIYILQLSGASQKQTERIIKQ